jgi:predicted Rossmann-fold nucleotide-binding protein
MAFDPRCKCYFVRITMVFFVLDGGGGTLAEIFTIRNNKNRKNVKF